MKKQTFYFGIILLFAAANIFSQQSVLLTVGNEKITVEEFLNVYRKNNNKEKQTPDKDAIREYLDLYSLFRMKVKEAKETGMDTTKAFRDELAGYRKTLAQPYLADSTTLDLLIKESYARMKQDIRTSHILVRINADPSPQDTMDAYAKIILIRDFMSGKATPAALKKYETMANSNLKISKNSPPKDTLAAYNKIHPLKEMFKLKTNDFASVAKTVSEHNSKTTAGDVNYLSGLTGFPYQYESAAFKAKPGQVFGPLRTPMGYHLILVTDKRPHTELHLEHLMLLFKKAMTHTDSLKLQMKTDSVYGLLKQGNNFEELTKKISEHKETAKKGGDLGWMAMSSNFPQEFKDAAYAIKSDNQFSPPVKTKYGWHIVKRLAARELLPFDSLKTNIKTMVQKDARNELIKEAFISKIKSQYRFKEPLPKCYTDFYAAVDSTLPMGKWKAEEKAKSLNKPLFSVLDKTFTQQDFASYMEKNYRKVGKIPPQRMVDALYKQFVEETCMTLKESRLEEEYPQFKALMKEYNDGILLFNLTDQKVWSKAIKDTTGAKEFHEKNKEKFLWEERLDATVYTCKNEKIAEQVKKLLKKNKSDKEILDAVNKDTTNVSAESKLFLKGDHAMLDANWTPGITSNQQVITGITSTQKVKNQIVFANIRKITKPVPKSYQEARGLVAGEYQSYLEKQWIDSLKKKYPVTIDQKILDSIQ